VNQNAKKGTEGNPGPAWRLFLDFEGEAQALRELATEPKNERFKEIMEEELKPRPKITPEEEPTPAKSPLKPQPNPSPSEQPQPPPPEPPLTSTRTISLPVLNRPAGALWFWFQQRTKCIDVPESEADKQLAVELAEKAARAEEDRRRVKKAIDHVKTQELMLKIARGEVDRMRAEEVEEA
jgi:hypothetical protein